MSYYFIYNSVFDIYRSCAFPSNIIDVKAKKCNRFDFIEIYRLNLVLTLQLNLHITPEFCFAIQVFQYELVLFLLLSGTILSAVCMLDEI